MLGGEVRSSTGCSETCVSEALSSDQGQKGAGDTTEGCYFPRPFIHLDSKPVPCSVQRTFSETMCGLPRS